ncbi:hypothetical protein G6F36_010926 [Rhizopus arrhizus]|nr:hypothetical protein G6F36_010926 [Rhizopus arrhizus]
MSSIEENIEISRPSQETSPHPLDDTKTLITLDTQSSSDFPELATASTPWRNPEQVCRLKENLLQKEQQRRQQCQETAVRLLQPPSENQGFQCFYLSTKARFPVGQIRSRLRELEIDNNRILDINYLDRNVVILLTNLIHAIPKFYATLNMPTLPRKKEPISPFCIIVTAWNVH